MLAHIIARDVGQRCREVSVGGAFGNRAFAWREQWRNAPPAPGPAEVEPVEMSDLAIAAITYDRRLKRVAGSPRPMSRQEVAEPVAEIARVRFGPCTVLPSALATGIHRLPAPTPGNRDRLPNQCRGRVANLLGKLRDRTRSAHSSDRTSAKAVLKCVPTRIG